MTLSPPFLPTVLMTISMALTSSTSEWLMDDHKTYRLYYTKVDQQNKTEYAKLVENGMKSVQSFFADSYKKSFDVYVHPHRQSLDHQWQKDWGMPDFKSECWMVASGVATKLDVISPKAWEKEACEHSYSDPIKTQQLITHELLHVYHGQRNISPDFSDVYDLDWFVEGLATYASGQCDVERIEAVKKLIADDKAPKSLNDFWKGNAKYGLSGSVVMYIDRVFGRAILITLLPLNRKTEILAALNVTEEDLLTGWKKYLQDFPVTK